MGKSSSLDISKCGPLGIEVLSDGWSYSDSQQPGPGKQTLALSINAM